MRPQKHHSKTSATTGWRLGEVAKTESDGHKPAITAALILPMIDLSSSVEELILSYVTAM